MSTSLQFITDFRVLHEKAKKGVLTPLDKERYRDARVHFGRIVVIAQQLSHSGQTLRSTLRASTMLKVEIKPDVGEVTKSSTIDLSSGGFAILMSGGMGVGKAASFTLHLPKMGGGADLIAGRCKVASSRAQTGLFRVSFKFDELAAPERERLEFVLIDAVLERFKELG